MSVGNTELRIGHTVEELVCGHNVNDVSNSIWDSLSVNGKSIVVFGSRKKDLPQMMDANIFSAPHVQDFIDGKPDGSGIDEYLFYEFKGKLLSLVECIIPLRLERLANHATCVATRIFFYERWQYICAGIEGRYFAAAMISVPSRDDRPNSPESRNIIVFFEYQKVEDEDDPMAEPEWETGYPIDDGNFDQFKKQALDALVVNNSIF